jgi:hypothetical protein
MLDPKYLAVNAYLLDTYWTWLVVQLTVYYFHFRLADFNVI